ncbi:SDR family oxidoreductase [Microbacterium sp. KSW-18]|uniref:SDR family oxidoreductase n=1 Tax=Microbacterium aquilitoris TaxID=3067307 RepID=A0ABU3GK09_9MICO|nr:SDR family oxidoreductase [Microbacterium sp. KSW-18]MDT3330769.1 SDR family oxidoreductase [Microbacterium sp. KSW-18]
MAKGPRSSASIDRRRGVTADVTAAQGAEALVDASGAVDVLVNNLGIFGSTPALEIDDDEWRRLFAVNVLNAARLTRLVLPGMTGRGWGRVPNIASDSAIVIPKDMIHYGALKSALLAMSRRYAKAASGTGVTVNSVIAGLTDTEGVEDFVYELVDRPLDCDAAQREFMRTARPQSPIGRLIEPAEIANMVVYLASPLASTTAGGALRVDGGYVDSILP